MSERSEYRRGYRSGKEAFKRFRSFFMKDGELYGYTTSGSLNQFGPLSHWRATKGFSGGYYKALKEAIKAHPTKVRESSMRPRSSFGFSDVGFGREKIFGGF